MSTRVLVEPTELVFIQSRAATNTDLVDEYAEMMQNGVEFDPVQGVQDETGQIYVYRWPEKFFPTIFGPGFGD